MMNILAIVVAALFVILAAWAVTVWQRSRTDTQMGGLRQELHAWLAAQGQSFTGQLGQVTQLTAQELGRVRQELQRGIADTGRLASDAQRQVAEQLRSSTEALAHIRQQIGEMQQSSRDLSQATQTLQTVLSGAKTRGSLGEVALEGLLADALPQSAYETQYRFSTGAVVDAMVRSGEKIVCLDSKFPLDAYRRLVETGEDSRKEFAQAVRKHAESIAEKYILPDEGTLDVALMFVPSEGVYYELLMTADAKGRLDDYCRSMGVIPVSPNSLHAYLSAILIGLKGMYVAENARQLLNSLDGLKRQLDDFADSYEKLGKHLHNARQTFEEADSKLERARGALQQMTQGALPEAPPKALEPAAKD